MSMSLRHWLRSPKGQLIVLFVPLLLRAATGHSTSIPEVMPVLIGGLLGAIAVDLPVLRWKKGRWVVPDGAILTGLIVAMILSPHERWWVSALTAAIGTASKYVLRTRGANVLNPAALGLVASFYLFQAGQSWWGSMTEVRMAWIGLLLIVGVYISDRVNRLPAAITFLLVYYALFTVTTFTSDAPGLAEVYRPPDLQMTLYFAFFMVTDPPTSPSRARPQVIFGAMTAVVAYLVFTFVGAVWWLPGGLLAANVWEGARRVVERTRRASLNSGTAPVPGN